MIRTIFAIGLFAVLGLFALRVVFGIFGVVFGLFAGLLFFAIKIAITLLLSAAARVPSASKSPRLSPD